MDSVVSHSELHPEDTREVVYGADQSIHAPVSCETMKLLEKSEEGLARYMQGSGFYTQHGVGAERERSFLYFFISQI